MKSYHLLLALKMVCATAYVCLLCIVQAEQQKLGQQLTQQLEQLHRAAQAGVAVDPVALAAAAGAAARTWPGLTPPHTAAAVGHPAVAASFLRELAAFGKGAAAGAAGSLCVAVGVQGFVCSGCTGLCFAEGTRALLRSVFVCVGWHADTS